MNLKTLGNVSLIVVGVVIASIGEIKFDLTGFLYQAGGIAFEATRLVMVQRLLSSAEYKMDPLVSLYYFAPVCGVMNSLAALVIEVPGMSMKNIYDVGVFMLIANAMVAFLLNVSVVFLVSSEAVLQPELVLTVSRLAKPHRLSSPSVASLRTSCLLCARCSSGEPKSASRNSSATVWRWPGCCTTSSVQTKSSSISATLVAHGLSSVPRALSQGNCWFLVW